jgi:hypothetical protein
VTCTCPKPPCSARARIYAGFLRDGGWGGNEVLRELVQDEDGWLGLRFVPEMIPACGEDMPVAFTESEGPFEQTSPDTIRLAASGADRTETTTGNLRGRGPSPFPSGPTVLATPSRARLSTGSAASTSRSPWT